MRRRKHWRERALYVDGDPLLVGEDEDGRLWVPSRNRRGWWDRRLSLWRPTHWPYYLRTRLRGAVAMIESGGGA